MKKRLAVLTLALSVPFFAFAEAGAPGGGGWRHHGPNMERLTEELNLSDEQRTQLEAIFKEQRAKHKALREEGRARMKEVLNEEQIQKMDEKRKRRHERWKERKDCFKAKEPRESDSSTPASQ